jgi:ABC-type uncharacterized transport system involved in gliding motility auxiliary subunit
MDHKRSATIYVTIYIIAFILVNLISMNWFIRFDLTDNKMYSLSDSSKQTIEKINDPLTIDLYFSDDLPGQLQNNKRFVQDLLEEYSAYSNNVNFYFVKNDENFNNKAQADGIQSQDVQVIDNDEISFKTIFMGMKIRYNGKSEVIQLLGVNTGLEYMLTKSIKKDLSAEEITGLLDYINSGGKILLAQGRIKPDIQTQQGTIIESNIFNILDSLGLQIEPNLILDKNCKQLMARQQTGMFSIQRQIDYPFIPSINNFEEYENQITGLEGIQVVQVGFPSEITYTKDDNSFTPLLKTSNYSAVMKDFFNLGAMPEINPILNELNESSKVIGGKLKTNNDGEILLITDSDFFSDESIAGMRIVRNDINENYTFIENIIDVMIGDAELVSLRSREVMLRPLIDEAMGQENSSLRTRWKWIDLLLPSLIIIGYGLLRKRSREKRSKYLMEIYG